MQRQYKPIPAITQKVSDRLFSKIVCGITPDDCWGWLPPTSKKGYCPFWIGGKPYYAHRVSYFMANGSIDDTLEVMHSCDNPACSNPRHLSQGSHRENIMGAVARGRVIPPGLKGEQSGRSKLTESDVRRIRALVASGISQREVARQYGVHSVTVHYIVHRVNWPHVD